MDIHGEATWLYKRLYTTNFYPRHFCSGGQSDTTANMYFRDRINFNFFSNAVPLPGTGVGHSEKVLERFRTFLQTTPRCRSSSVHAFAQVHLFRRSTATLTRRFTNETHPFSFLSSASAGCGTEDAQTRRSHLIPDPSKASPGDPFDPAVGDHLHGGDVPAVSRARKAQ
jgi:hypothetical protein